MKRNDNRSTYRVETKRAIYLVTFEKLRNSTSGAPRYNANIIVLEVIGEPHAGETYYTANYTFKGSYQGEQKEARDIVDIFESEAF